VDEVVGQLKKLAITGSSRKDRMFLGVDVGRLGFVNRTNLRDMCVNHQLPCDDDIVDLVCTFRSPVFSTSGIIKEKRLLPPRVLPKEQIESVV